MKMTNTVRKNILRIYCVSKCEWSLAGIVMRHVTKEFHKLAQASMGLYGATDSVR